MSHRDDVIKSSEEAKALVEFVLHEYRHNSFDVNDSKEIELLCALFRAIDPEKHAFGFDIAMHLMPISCILIYEHCKTDEEVENFKRFVSDAMMSSIDFELAQLEAQ